MSRRREGRIQSAIALHLCPNTLPISPHCWGQLTSIAKNKFECISWHWYISQSGFAGGWQKMDHWLLGHRRARTICQVARLLLFSGRNPWNRRNPWPHAPATLPGQRIVSWPLMLRGRSPTKTLRRVWPSHWSGDCMYDIAAFHRHYFS